MDGLVIPGGESSTFLKLLGETGFEKLKQFVRHKPTFGTCAGAILLAKEVENPQQAGMGAIDIRFAATPTAASSTAPSDKESLGVSLKLRSKWSSSAPPGSSVSVPESRSWPPRAATRSSSAREP